MEYVPGVNGSGSGSGSEPAGSWIQFFGSVAALLYMYVPPLTASLHLLYLVHVVHLDAFICPSQLLLLPRSVYSNLRVKLYCDLHSTGVAVVTFLVGVILGAGAIIIFNNKRYVNSVKISLSIDAHPVFRLSFYIYFAVC